MSTLELGTKMWSALKPDNTKSGYSRLPQHIEIPIHTKILTFVPPFYVSHLDGLYQMEMARFKDCFKKGKILSLLFDSRRKLK